MSYVVQSPPNGSKWFHIVQKAHLLLNMLVYHTKAKACPIKLFWSFKILWNDVSSNNLGHFVILVIRLLTYSIFFSSHTSCMIAIAQQSHTTHLTHMYYRHTTSTWCSHHTHHMHTKQHQMHTSHMSNHWKMVLFTINYLKHCKSSFLKHKLVGIRKKHVSVSDCRWKWKKVSMMCANMNTS